jgi:hypothetical protein
VRIFCLFYLTLLKRLRPRHCTMQSITISHKQEVAIISPGQEHECQHKSEGTYRRCVVFEDFFVKFGSYKSIYLHAEVHLPARSYEPERTTHSRDPSFLRPRCHPRLSDGVLGHGTHRAHTHFRPGSLLKGYTGPSSGFMTFHLRLLPKPRLAA